MEEKIVIKSEKYKLGKLYIALLLIGIAITTIMIINSINTCASIYEWHYEDYQYHMERGYCDIRTIMGVEVKTTCSYCARIMECGTREAFIWDYFLQDAAIFTLIPVGISLLVVLIIFFYMHGYEITVSDKRVYGKTIFGKTIDLPIDSVSSTAEIKISKGISIATSSGRISFRGIKNACEIYEILNQLLIERQSKKKDGNITHIEAKSDEADQLKKYKDLLDSGVITQEEFDAKKKQLLGL